MEFLPDAKFYIFIDMLLSFAYLVFLVIFPLAQQEEDGWKLKREKDGISVSIREQADSHI